ncbi:MAG TPA: M14 family zinc carboxypeptidase [Draconibacterium sp.]|nr:M14 family zinc carboxypeptidase [Draconibacterium sp.]
MKRNFFSLKGILSFFAFLFAISSVNAQTKDTVYQNKIIEYTTDSKFLPSSVTTITLQPGIPSPLSYFGSIIGAPGVMHHTQEIYGYLKKLADSSPKMQMEQVGNSEEGRPIYMVTISSESTIKNLEHYKNIMTHLADPRITDQETATKLAKEGKPVYFINGGMHSGEMGSPEMLMELAYRLVTDTSEEIQNILDNCIVLIDPVSEPDGRDKQVDWYYRYTKGRKDFDDGFEKTPPYWGKYVFHDNNRDGLQISQEITKAIFNIYFDWHPTIMLDLHESIPLLYISTGTGPYNMNVDPITVGEWQTIANQELTELSAQGLPGAFDWAFYDGWWPGYGIWVANNHNSIGRFYETFGNAGADTYLRDISKARFAGDLVTSRQWYRPDPATGKLYWSARNNINYMEAAALASLKYVAANGENFLKNFYQKGVNSVNFSKNNDIKMYVIPEKQRDPVMAAYLVNQLRKQGIEVHKVKNTEREYVVLLNQPYGRFANDLLSEQKYPKDAKFPPYDAIAWTLGYMYGVDVHAADSMRYSKDDLTMVKEPVGYNGKIQGNGSDYFLKYKGQSTVLSGLYDAKKQHRNFQAFVVDSVTVHEKDTLQRGTIVLQGLNKKQAGEWAEKYGIDLTASDLNLSEMHEITLPRIAVFHSWTDTQAEGWVRFTLEQKGIPYISIDKDDLKKGNLRKDYDVIIIPNQGGNFSSFVDGVDSRFGPMPYTKTKSFPSHGYPDSNEDITGGPGLDGVNNLSQFVKEGGTLVPLGNSASIIADAGMAPGVSSFNPSGLFHPGSIVTVKARNTHSPILYGYPEVFHIFKGNGKLLSTRKYDRNMLVLQYGTQPLSDELPYKGKILGQKMADGEKESTEPKDTTKVKDKKAPEYVLSGMVRNEKAIIGNGVILDTPLGKGRIIFFTFNPFNRYLNHYDSSLLWNVMMNWNHL